MSRSQLTEDMDDNWFHICYRGQVASAIRGRRGQAFLRELLNALDSLPEPRLIENELEDGERGDVCALGAVAKRREMDITRLDPNEPEQLAGEFGIAHQLIREIEFENDEVGHPRQTPEERFRRVRQWVVNQLKEES